MPPHQRKIIHIDMDAFFASVEQRDNPQLQGKPVIVGGQPDSRGVVAACSYEARQYGIHSAMPSSHAYKLCPHAVFVAPRIEAYKEVSKQIHNVFWQFASTVEPLSLDEAYLDVSHSEQYSGSATRIAQAIKIDIQQQTQLVASAGISYNKFLAKIASDMDKPNGLYVIKPEQGASFIAKLAIGKFYGVGPATEAKMHALGIRNGADLAKMNRLDLITRFGKSGDYFYQIARGIDLRPVQNKKARKSFGKETTFKHDIHDRNELITQINTVAKKVFNHLHNNNILASTVTLKIKYSDFQSITRTYSCANNITQLNHLTDLLPGLLSRTEAEKKGVRLVGVSVSKLTTLTNTNNASQLELNLA